MQHARGVLEPSVTIVVVGAGSMIARALRQQPASAGWRYLAHGEALGERAWLAGARCVVNLAFDPRLKAEPYDPARDVDLRLAGMLAEHEAAYVMVSTRMVYGLPPPDGRLSEEIAPQPANYYGRAKLAAERAVAGLLGNRLTVLRLSNIFDVSEAEGGRRSFFGIATTALREQGRIVLDISPFVERDFLSAALCAKRIATVAVRPLPGLFNVGAGSPVPTGRIAQWLIAGFGSGSLLISNMREYDGFWLDIERSRRAWGFAPVSAAEIRDDCIAIGRHLRGLT